MRSARFMLLFGGATLLASCDDEGDFVLAPEVPLAYTRFVHAVPDTGATDWRFIDQLEYSPVSLGLTFRGFSPYQGTRAGARHLRVFPTSSNINITQNHLVDETITFEAGRFYTLVHVGYSRAGQTPEDQLVVIEDDIPTIAATEVAVRAMHLGTGLVNPDVYATASTSDPIAGSPLFANVAYGDATSYTARPIGAFAFRATPTGQTSPVIASATAPAGSAGNATQNLTTIGGSTMGGSAILGIFTPGSVVASRAPQTGAFVVQSSSATLSASSLGYSRPSGSFTTDGFVAGQTITASGFDDPANNGTATVNAITPVRETGEISLAATPGGYVRTSGDFVADGFIVDMWVTVTGFTDSDNNGRFRVTAVTPTVLSVSATLVTEAADDEREIVSDQILRVTKTPAPVAEASAPARALVGPPRPAWVYVIDKHPR